MAKPKDTLSNESTHQKKHAPTGLGWASKLMGKAADVMANREIFGEMQSRNVTPADVPVLKTTALPGGGQNTAQLQVINMPFVSPDSGKTHQIEGYHLPAQPGKPTMVFFGGTDMDRTAPHYKDLIKTMADQAKQQGTGLIVMDYPTNANEGKIKAQVNQMQQHMASQMGIPLNQQAYAGYSLGGNPALYAARTNPDAAGLHLTSTVSSIRQESKNAMAAAGNITKIADKGQLSTLMDNIDETRRLIQTQQNRPGGPMPVSIAYSDKERFGEPGNNHMTPLLTAFNDYPGQVKVSVSNFNPNNYDPHQYILRTPENIESMRDFIRDADQSVQNRQGLPAPGVAPVLAPPVPAVAPVMPAGPPAAPGLMGGHRAAPPVPAPLPPPPPPLPVADLGAEGDDELTTSTQSLTTSTEDTTSLSEYEEEEIDFEGYDTSDDDDLGPDALGAESPSVSSLGSGGASSSSSSAHESESESEEEEVDLEALGFDFSDEDGPQVSSPAVGSGGASSSISSDPIEAEKKDNGLSFEPEEEDFEVAAYRAEAREVDGPVEEFDDFDLEAQLSQENRQQRELRPHVAPEPGSQEMKPLGQKYVDGEKNQPSRTTQVGDQEVSVKEKEWLRQTTNEKRAAEKKTAVTEEAWAAKKDIGTTLYMDEQQRQEAKVGFANQDHPSGGTSVAVTDQDGQDLQDRNIFVMDQEGQMFAYNEQDSTKKLKEAEVAGLEGNVPDKQVHVHHSSFLAGEDVAAAGEFVVGKNTVLRDQPLSQEEADELGVDAKTAEVSVLKEVNNRSGHYLPGAQQAMQSLDQFARQGVEMDNTKFTLHRSGADGGPTTVDGMAKEFMQGRATTEELEHAAGDEELTAKLKGAAEKTFVARHQVMEELKQGQPELKRVNRDDLPDERSTDRPKIEFDDDDDKSVAIDFGDDDDPYAPKVDNKDKAQEQKQPVKQASYTAADDEDFAPGVDAEDEEIIVDEPKEDVAINQAVEQKQKAEPISYSAPDDDDDFSPDVDDLDEDVELNEALEGPENEAKQSQPAPAVSGPAEDGPAPKAPSVRDSLRSSAQKQDGGFQEGVKPNSVREKVKVEIGAQRGPGQGPKVNT